MVAIVSGNNLGLNLSSLASIGPGGQFGNAALGQSGERTYVDVATGNLVVQDVDTALVGLGNTSATLRTYNSQGVFDHDNGDGWRGAPYKSVIQHGHGPVERTDIDGSRTDFLWDADRNAYVAQVGASQALDTIVVNATGQWVFTDGTTGRTETYQGTGQGLILSSSDTSGNTLTYTYIGNLLSRVENSDGEAVNYTYVGANLTEVSTELQNGQVISQVSYTYDLLNRLQTVSVTLNQSGDVPAGAESSATYTTTYEYDGNSTRLARVIQGDQTQLAFTYVNEGPGTWRVATVTDGVGQVTQFGYDIVARTTTVTDPLGVASVYEYDLNGQLVLMRAGVTANNPDGVTQLSYTYDGRSDLTSVTDALGRSVTYFYDTRGNQTAQVDALGNRLDRTFDAHNQLLTETVYPSAGQSLTSRYVYDGAGRNLLRFTVSAEGRVTEYRYNAATGLRESAIAYTEGLYPVAGLAPDAAPSEAQLQAWVASQNAAQTERSDFAYDFRGQLQTSTTYGEIDAAGNGVASTAAVTQYVYDHKGELLQTLTPSGTGATHMVYDGLGRLVVASSSATDASVSITTLTQYDDAGGRVTVELANGLTTVSAYDHAGRLATITQNAGGSALGTSSFVYDEAGRLAMTEDPTGVRNWILYDAAGRKVADIGPDGQLTEYIWDVNNKLVHVIGYAHKVDVAQLVDGADRPLTQWNANPADAPLGTTPVTLADLRQPSSADQKSWNFYDEAGRLCFQVDALGHATQTQYDGASRVLSVTRLAEAIDTSTLGDGTRLELLLSGFTTTTSLTEVIQGGASAGPNAPRLLVAQVSGQTTPTGLVSFYVGTQLLGTSEIVSGTASLLVSNLPAGLDAITAVYAGDPNNLGSTSNVVLDQVAPAYPATTTLTANAASAEAGATVTLTATVAGLNATGLVLFYSGTRAIGIAAVVNGVATLDVNNLPTGSNVLRAVYQGDEYNALSTSATVTEVVTRAASATSESVTTLLASNASSLPGQPVTLTALVSGAVPSGFVEFYSGAQLLGRVALADGLASLSVSSLPTGTVQLTARYEGDTLNTASTSAAVGVTVLRSSSVSLGASSPTAQLGAPVTLTANVNGAAPGGVVNFYSGTTLLGSAPVSGGVARLVVSTLPLGATTINALYSGDGANIASTSGVITVNVTPASTTTTLTTSSAVVAATADLTLTARVSGTGQASGLVTFYSGSTVIGTATISGGVATLTVNNLPVGNASLSAVYAGNAGNTTSTSAVVSETVTAANVTRTAVSASSTSATYGTPVTFTATISGAGTPGGTVTFYNGATAIGTASVSGGQATLTVATLPVGSASVTATYSGDASHVTSSAPAVAVAVARAPTQLALASSAATAAYGVPVTLTVTLAGASPGGTVTFFSGQTALGTAAVVNGQASLTVDTLGVGSLMIEATYAGDANNTTSVATLTQTITTAPTAATLSASQPSARQGVPVVLTAQVAGNAKSQPGGLVTFYNGATVLGTASVVNGFAAITVSNLPVGSSVLTANYAGDARTAASTSTAIVETIAAAPQNTTTTLVSSDNNLPQGSPFTLTATVAGSSPGGVVTFLNGQTVLGTATVNGSGVATLVTNIRTTGNWPITATYGGDAANATSVSSSVSVRIRNGSLPPAPPALPATTTVLTSSTASALRGDPVTLFARVTPSGTGPVPTGTVSFFVGTTLIGSASLASGQAALTFTDLPVGADQIRAVYSGDSAAASSTSTILNENISLAPSTVTLVPSATTITQGTGLVLTARVAGNVAPGGTVTFYNGATAIATVAVVNGLASQTFTNLAIGTRTLTARYNGDGNNAQATSTSSNVVVTAALATSTVGLSTTPNTVQVGQPLTLNATVSGASPTGTVSFFNGTTLLGSAVLTGGTATLSVTSLPPGGSSVTAVYSGDAANKAGASAASAENVTAASTTTTLAVSTPTAAYGSPLILTATVSGTGSPAGTVNFFNGTTLLGSATLTNGQASLSVSSLPAGTDSLRAVYVGNTANTTSASAIVNETITLAPTSVALASGAAIAPNGALTVLVSGVTPGGSVVFMSGQTVIGVASVVNGVATLQGTGLPVGSYALTALYGGDGNNAASALAFNQTIVITPSAITLSTASMYVAQNAPLVLTAYVAGSDPTGIVTFYNGATVLGTATVVNGFAAMTLSTLDDGVASLTAAYSGDTNNTASTSAALSERVLTAPVNISVGGSAPSASQGTALTLSAQVSGDNPSGTVAFVSGSTTLGSATIVNGIATLSIANLSLATGARNIVAVYMGDGNNTATVSQPFVLNVTLGIVGAQVGQSPDDRTITRIEDHDGRLRATIDAEGYLTEMRYNAAGRLTETVRYATAVSGFTDAASIALQVEQARATGSLAGLIPDPDGSDIHSYFYYNARGQKVGEVDGERYLTEFIYDVNGNLTQQIRYATAVTGALAGSSVAALRPNTPSSDDRVLTSTWDALNRLATQTNAEGTITTYIYDSVGRVTSTSVAVNTSDLRTLTVRYDVQGRVVAELSPEGAALLVGNPPQHVIDNAWANYATTHTYDAVGRRTSSTDANGHKTVFLYDDAGRLRYTVNAMGEVREQRYGALGRLEQTVSFNERLTAAALSSLQGGLLSGASLQTTQALAALAAGNDQSINTFHYDAAGRLIETLDAELGQTEFDYNAFDEVTTTTQTVEGGDRVSTSDYDRRGLQVESAAYLGQSALTTTREYDAFGRLTSTLDANGNLRTQSFDRLGRVIQTVDPINAERSTSYDAFDRVLTQTDALEHTTHYHYDWASRTATMTTVDGVTVTTVHNRHGQTSRVTDGRLNDTTYSYDRNGNLVQTDTELTSTSATYDHANLLLTTVDGNGITVEYEYDAANRLLTRTLDPAGTNPLVTRYDYDAKGRQFTVTDANQVVTRIGYDLNGRVVTQTVDPTEFNPDGLNLTTTYTYNEAGDVLTVTSPGGTVTRYVYDTLGRRTEEHLDPLGKDLTCHYAYDDNGNLVRKTDANDHVTLFAYDANDRLVFSVDAAGGVRETQYDIEGQVTGTIAYAVPLSLGTPAPLALTVGQVRALLSSSPNDVAQNQVFDAMGRLQFSVDGAGGVTQYFHDANGNTVRQISYAQAINRAAWTPGTAPAVTASASDHETRMVYDALNRVEWVCDGGDVSRFEYDDNGNVTRQVGYANKVDVHTWTSGATADPAHDADSHTVYDAANRAIFMVDGAGGLLAQKYDGNGNVIDRIAYATPLPAGTAFTKVALEAAALAIADTAHDAHIRRVYDAANRLEWSIDGTGAVTRQVYDDNGNLIKQVAYATRIAAGASPTTAPDTAADRVTLMMYDAVNQKVWQVDALGSVTGMTYDAVGNLVARKAYDIRAAAPTVNSDVSQLADQFEAIAPSVSGRTFRAVFDEANRQTYSIDPTGAVVHTVYDGIGQAIATVQYAQELAPDNLSLHVLESDIEPLATTADDRWTLRAFDGAGRSKYTVDALGYVTRSEYDGLGQVTSSTLYARSISNEQTPNPALAGQRDAIAALLQPNALDRTDTFTYDGAGNLISSRDAANEQETFSYDGLGNKLTFTNKKHDTWTYTYDTAGRLLTETSPIVELGEGRTPTAIVSKLTYDALGNLLTRTEAFGIAGQQRTTSYAYDALGRQVKTTFPPVAVYDGTLENIATNGANSLAIRTEQTVELSSEVTYNVFGDAVSSRDVADHFSYKVYDKLGQVTHEIDALGQVTHYDRGTFGDVTTLTRYASALTLPAAGADEGQVAAALSGLSAAGARAVQTEYDRLGRAVRVIEPQTWVHPGPGQAGYFASKVTRNIYNAFGEVERSGVDVDAQTYVASTNYYDRRGQLIGVMDPLGYLTTMQYDAAGNVIGRTEYANSFLGVAGPLPLGQSVQSQPLHFNAVEGGLTGNNPNGPWQYGWKPTHGTGAFTLFDTRYPSDWPIWTPSWTNPSIYWTPYVGVDPTENSMIVHPGPSGQVAVARWTAPSAGTFDLHFNITHAGSTSRRIYLNGQLFNDGNFNGSITLAQGDVLDVEVGANGSYFGDGTWYTLTIDSAGGAVPVSNASVEDRVTTYEYDGLNRKVGETRFNFEHSNDGGTPTTTPLTATYSYDAVGNLLATTDAMNNVVSSEYDALGRVTRVLGPVVDIVGASNIRAETDFFRDAYGNIVLQRQVGAGGLANRDTRIVYDSHGHATQVTDAEDYLHFMSYDKQGQLVKQWQAVQGNEGPAHTLYTFFEYDALGRQTDVVTPGTNSVVSGGSVAVIDQAAAGVVHARSIYNAFGEVTQRGTYRDNAVQLDERYDYDAAGHLIRANAGDGNYKVMLYNVMGFQTVQIAGAGGVDNADLANVSSAQAADGLTVGVRRTDVKVDALGRALEQHLPLRSGEVAGQTLQPVLYQTFDRWGNVLSQSDPRNSAWVTSFRYNANNQVVQQTQPGGATTRIRYDALGRQTGVVDANGNLNRQEWDGGGNLVSEFHADGGEVEYGYNVFGERQRMTDAESNRTTYTRDRLGRLTEVRGDAVTIAQANTSFNVSFSSGSLATTYTYDSAGRKLTERNGAGEITRYTYDLRGNVTATQQPMGQISRTAFDQWGHQAAVQDANGVVSTWNFDYFGQVLTHTDLGGASHSYFYDGARQLTQQTSSRGQNIGYSYDAAGQLMRIDDAAIGQVSEYRYDAAGHRIKEYTAQGGTVYQNNVLHYDSLGRLDDIQALDNFHISFTYDAAGNKVHQHIDGDGLARSVEGVQQIQTGEDENHNPIYTEQRSSTTVFDATSQDLWFAYDSMNRQVLVDGVYSSTDLSTNNINSAQGHVLTYDRNGNRKTDTSWGQQVVGQQVLNYDESSGQMIPSGVLEYSSRSGVVKEYYDYDRMNRVGSVSTDSLYDVDLNPIGRVTLDTRYYDAAGRLVQNGPAGTLSNDYVKALNPGPQANGASTRINVYDANGRLQAQHVAKPDGSFDYETVYAGTFTSEETVYSGDDENGNPMYYTQIVTTTGPGYDNAGNILGYRATDSSGVTSSYNMTLARFEGYKENTVSGFRSDNMGQVRTTTNHYDVNGNLTSIDDDTGEATAHRTFVNDANGMILQKNQQGHILKQLVVGGELFASYGLAQNPQDPASYTNQTQFNTNYQPITNSYPSAGTGAYTVRSGDTLQTIAKAAYGDSQLWYLIADANGLAGDRDLRVGQTLNIPTKVGSIHNTADTFKPYDPSKVIGDTTPQLPVPQNDDDDCGGFGQIIMIVVAVVVAYFTAGAALAWIAPGATAATASVGALAVAGAIGGAVGSIASQLVGNAIGAVDGFSWKAVALAAIGGAVGGGMQGIAGGTGPLSGSGFGATVARAAIGNALTQGIAVATGLQDKFNWRGVAASAVGAGIGYGVNQALAGDTLPAGQAGPVRPAAFAELGRAGDIIRAGLSGFAAGVGAAVVRGGKVSVTQIATDAFGNALGDSLVGYLNEPSAQELASQKAKQDFRRSEILEMNATSGSAGGLTPAQTEAMTRGWGPLTDEAARRRLAVQGQPSSASTDEQLNQSAPSAGAATPSAPSTVRAGDYGGSLERIARAQLGAGASQREINNYVGQLFEINNISNARTIQGDRSIVLPGADTAAATRGLGLYGKDIAIGEQIKAERYAAQVAADQAAQNAYLSRNDAALAASINQQFALGMASYVQSMSTPVASGPGGRYEDRPSTDPLGMPNGSTERVWISDGPETPYLESVGKAALTSGKLLYGMGQLALSGAYNGVVKIGAGAASVPYLVFGVEAAVAVQEGTKARFGWTPQSEGAQMIGRAMAPVAQAVSEVSTSVRSFSERHIGDGATTFLGATVEAGLEIAGLVSGGRAAQGFLDSSAFVWRPMPNSPVLGTIGVPPTLEGLLPTRITTVTGEMSDRFQGMGYRNPLTNEFAAVRAGETMAVDHIFPSAEIVKLPGFNTLTKDQMASILQDTVGLGNLQPLPKTFNSSKGSSTNWTTYKNQPLDPVYAATLAQQQNVLRTQIQLQIKTYQQQNLPGTR